MIFFRENNIEYSSEDVLQQLDKCANDFTFPMLDNGYIYLIDSRLSAYRDNKRWALVIEVLGFSYRGGGHNGITNCLHIFGNCLEFEPGTNNSNFIYLTNDSEEGETFDEEYQESLNPDAKSMLLRENRIPVPIDPVFYQKKGIELEEPPQVKVWEFLRGINDDYKELFLATEDEIRARIPKDLPLILRLNEWFHNDLAGGEKPSENETFKMIAKVLETGNLKYYAPNNPPNNHWKNWPDGGTL